MSDLAAVLRHLRPLVGLDTTSSRSNLALIELISGWLAAAGVKAQILPNVAGNKAGLIASIGPERAGGVVLAGHTDTVPVEGQTWHSNPFTLVERGERLVGRGTTDMKGFIAAVLAMLPVFTRAPLKVPIHLLFSYDEEIGCLAAPALVSAMRERLPQPALAIVGEPSEMRIASAHRGIATYSTTVHGREGHSGLPASGVNAIVAASRCVLWLDDLAATLMRQAEASGDTELATTLNIGTITGGTAINIIASECRIDWECRPAPGFAVSELEGRFNAFLDSELLPRLQGRAPEAGIETVRSVLVPPLRPPSASDAQPFLAATTEWAGSGPPTTVPFASEAGFFQAAGIPTLICGPGSARQAHQADEFVTGAQLQACVAFLQHLSDWATRADEERLHSLASPTPVP